MELAFELVTFILGHETHGLFRIFIFYVVPSTFHAFFGPQANSTDTCLEKVSRFPSVVTQSQCILLEAARCTTSHVEK